MTCTTSLLPRLLVIIITTTTTTTTILLRKIFKFRPSYYTVFQKSDAKILKIVAQKL